MGKSGRPTGKGAVLAAPGEKGSVLADPGLGGCNGGRVQ
jgi:hypothetical protein